MVIATIPVGYLANGIAVTPDGSEVYVAKDVAGTTGYPVPGIVSVIDTMTNTVVGSPIPVGSDPYGIAITPDGSKVYVTNEADNTVSVIDTATNMVVAVLPVGGAPIGFGVFIQPRFAGTPGNRECHHKSISALTRTFGGLNRATIALGFPTVEGLLSAVNAFCGDRACDEEDRRACMFVGENSEHRAVRRRERSSFSR
jgi:YVTN family beta-propeller protein